MSTCFHNLFPNFLSCRRFAFRCHLREFIELIDRRAVAARD
jgi:hypothetical protein